MRFLEGALLGKKTGFNDEKLDAVDRLATFLPEVATSKSSIKLDHSVLFNWVKD